MYDVFSWKYCPNSDIYLSDNCVINFSFLISDMDIVAPVFCLVSTFIANQQLLRYANDWIVCCLLSTVPAGCIAERYGLLHDWLPTYPGRKDDGWLTP
jgi:hypothetical protein